AIAATFVCPLYVIKTRLQVRDLPNTSSAKEIDISQKDEKPSKKQQNRSRDGKVCEGEAQSKSSQLREEKAKKNVT
ncbi:hypothetical protein Tco_1205068, partial [Tanacetum coccineum]